MRLVPHPGWGLPPLPGWAARRRACYGARHVKKALLIAVVVVVIVTGVPLVVSMAGMSCPDCGPATLAATPCAVLLAAVGLFLAFAAEVLVSRRGRSLGLLHAVVVERPPRLA